MGPKVFIATVLIFVAGAALFYLKYSVEQKEARLTEMRAQYLEDQKALRVLKAEWTYLNSPGYLQNLARRYLTLRPMDSRQVIAWFDSVPGYIDVTPFKAAGQGSFQSAREVVQASMAQPPEARDEP
ncbi:MAG: hypothetical protein E2O91_05200 [Alphaproteobacteria bacterium]|nr:MAG: hypothetical protein E2O91_05200 [Alphaproteobacteria bacterium]